MSSPLRVLMSAGLLDRLLAEAAARPHEEICGLLFGDAGRIDAAEATVNVAADRSCMFEIDPGALIAALRAERGGGRRVIGCYHSHPGGSAEPSTTDLAAAEPGKLWLILGSGAARLWQRGTQRFDEVGLVAD